MSGVEKEIKQLQSVQKSLAIAQKATSSALLDAKKKSRAAAKPKVVAKKPAAKKPAAKKAKKVAKKAKK
jgi:hypothetical protein